LDIFDYPPTAIEIWRFLGVRAELGEVINILPTLCHSRESGNPALTHIILGPAGVYPRENGDGDDAKNSFYFLPGRNELVKKRREFFQLSEKKFRIAKRAAWLLHFIPGIKMVALCNNFYYHPESDVDFFIITGAKRLWLTRFFATLLLDFFNLRARGKKTTDKICLSFYLSEANLDLENIALKPDDPYFYYWLAFLEPIYGQECYSKFWQANSWLKNIFPNSLSKEPVARRRIENNFLSLAVKMVKSIWFYGALGDVLEKIVKKIQWQKISSHVKEMAAAGDTRVMLDETMLKFHENDRREEFRRNYELRIKNYKL